MPQFVFVCHIFSDGQKKAAIPFSTAKAALVIKTKLYLLAQRKPKLFKTYLDCRLVRMP